MMNFLQTGRALYVLAAICLAGIFTRLAAGSFYKRLIKESGNLALTKNRFLRNLKQNAEDTYRINLGMNNTRIYLERQLYSMRLMGISLRGLENLSGQLTLLCFLAGGAAAFMCYWYRSDNYYIVLYAAVGILGGMLTMLVDYGVDSQTRRQQLLTNIQDYMENVMWPRMAREGVAEPQVLACQDESRDSSGLRSVGRERRSQGRRGIDQAAASREKVKDRIPDKSKNPEDRTGENWLQDLNPEQKRVLGEMLKEFIS